MKTEVMNIPIYRAKRIDGDEYVEGYLRKDTNQATHEHVWVIIRDKDYWKFTIDPSTLAIHFPDMKDSEGNKIFASLSKDGKGGDLFENFEDSNYTGIAIMQDGNSNIIIPPFKRYSLNAIKGALKITGIQE